MVASSYNGARILIPGGTGSFGHAMVRKLLHSDCGEIRILSRDEEEQDRMRPEMGDERLNFYLGDHRRHRKEVKAPAEVVSTRLFL